MESARYLLIRIVNIIGGVIGIFLLLRIVLRLLAANSATPIVSWVYSISASLAFPFKGIFRDVPVPGLAIFDMSALIALLAYSIVFSLIVAAINAITTPIILHRHSGQAHIH